MRLINCYSNNFFVITGLHAQYVERIKEIS